MMTPEQQLVWSDLVSVARGGVSPTSEVLIAADAELRDLRAQRDALLEALLNVARMAEALKRDCGMDSESPQAIRNGKYMNISYAARAAIASVEGKQ